MLTSNISALNYLTKGNGSRLHFLQDFPQNRHYLSYMDCLSFFYSEAQHEKTSFHIETSLCETVWWNESQKESLCYTPVNSWSTGMIVFYAVTDISIVSPKIWMIWQQSFTYVGLYACERLQAMEQTLLRYRGTGQIRKLILQCNRFLKNYTQSYCFWSRNPRHD